MKLITATFSFLKRVLTSRVGHLLLVINLCFIAYDYSRTPVRPYESDGSCYTVGEARNSPIQLCPPTMPTWLVVGVFLNLPAGILTLTITESLKTSSPAMCVQTASQITTLLFINFASIQWLFVGYGVEKLLKKHFSQERRT